MNAKARFLAVAEAEYRDAIDYYNAEVVGLGDDFREEFITALQRIADFRMRGKNSPNARADAA